MKFKRSTVPATRYFATGACRTYLIEKTEAGDWLIRAYANEDVTLAHIPYNNFLEETLADNLSEAKEAVVRAEKIGPSTTIARQLGDIIAEDNARIRAGI